MSLDVSRTTLKRNRNLHGMVIRAWGNLSADWLGLFNLTWGWYKLQSKIALKCPKEKTKHGSKDGRKVRREGRRDRRRKERREFSQVFHLILFVWPLTSILHHAGDLRSGERDVSKKRSKNLGLKIKQQNKGMYATYTCLKRLTLRIITTSFLHVDNFLLKTSSRKTTVLNQIRATPTYRNIAVTDIHSQFEFNCVDSNVLRMTAITKIKTYFLHSTCPF